MIMINSHYKWMLLMCFNLACISVCFLSNVMGVDIMSSGFFFFLCTQPLLLLYFFYFFVMGIGKV